MIEILKLIVALALGYLLGSLNAAVIVGKIYGPFQYISPENKHRGRFPKYPLA